MGEAEQPGRRTDIGAIDELIEAAEERWKQSWAEGPKRTRWTTLPPQLGDQAPDAELTDTAGRSVRLASSWVAGPALILFWRHFGCSCGMDRARRLTTELPDYHAAGANVIIVGQGEPERAARYAERQGIDVSILVDPDRRGYEAYGLLEGTTAQILFDAPDEFLRCDLEAGLSLSASRHGTDRALVDNPWQLPGEFVVAPDGRLAHAHRYQWCEDYPDPRVHVAAIRAAGGRL